MKNLFFISLFAFLLVGCLSYSDFYSSKSSSTKNSSSDKIYGTLKDQDVWEYYITTEDYYPSVIIMDKYSKMEKAAFNKNEIPNDTRTKKYINYGNGCFIILRDTDRVYKFNDKPFKPYTKELIIVYYYDFNEQKTVWATGNYFNINGLTDDKSVDVYENGKYKYYTFNKAGIITFNVTIGELNETTTIEVIELPFPKYSSVDTIVETIGFPDIIKSDGVSWPDEKYVHGFYYKPKAGHTIFKEFYFYKKYPYLVLSNSNNTIDGVTYERLID